MVAQTTISSHERVQGQYGDNSLSRAVALYQEAGYLELVGAFDPAFIRELHRSYLEQYGDRDTADLTRKTLQVGDARFMVALKLQGPFFDPRLYANPFVIGL